MSEPLPIEVDVLVVGAGQAGLGAAYWLTRQPGLRGLRFPAGPTRCPTRVEMADYLRT